MSDWKQITARIRRARGSKDPAAQLSHLFQKTRDAMVAFELARYLETSGNNGDAAQWYVTAAHRFRRADWKTKAQEAAVRLGGDLTTGGAAIAEPARAADVPVSTQEEDLPGDSVEIAPASLIMAPATSGSLIDKDSALEETAAASGAGTASPEIGPAAASEAVSKRRHRGRRGGRNRRKGGEALGAAAAVTAQSAGESASLAATTMAAPVTPALLEPAPPRVVDSRAMPRLPVEEYAESGAPALKGRFGDPGLSSRISLLEMQFRRLLACPPAKLEDASHAPAGPGVFVLTDDDMTTYYHVESCQTLRIAIANLSRGGAARRGAGESIKKQLAGHLGIPETRAAKYLSDHCVVRWLQLDEGAEHFAHFAIAILRPELAE
jgi:hypothetical protein